MNALIEMATLFYRHPAPDASASEVAAWYLAKGKMHEDLARENGADAAQELAYAASAYEHGIALQRRAVRPDVASESCL